MSADSNKTRNRLAVLGVLPVILLILEVLAFVILSVRLSGLTFARGYRISLSSGGTSSVLTILAGGQEKGPSDDDFEISDADTVWQTDTKVNIFETLYGNESKGVIAKSSDGSKIIAPGTGNTYRFTLDNTGKFPLDYTLSFESKQEGYTSPVPVEARIYDEKGEFCFGSDEEWKGIEKISEAEDKNSLKSGESLTYTLEWRWLFDGNDDLDTFMGNQSAESPVTLTLGIKTVAEIDGEGGGGEEEPGKDWLGRSHWALLNFICMIATVAIGVYELIIFLRGKKEAEIASEYPDYLESQVYTRRVRRRKRKLFDLIPVVLAVVAFVLTENMLLPMVFVDKWSPVMVIILLISITIAFMTRLRRIMEEIKDVIEVAEIPAGPDDGDGNNGEGGQDGN